MAPILPIHVEAATAPKKKKGPAVARSPRRKRNHGIGINNDHESSSNTPKGDRWYYHRAIRVNVYLFVIVGLLLNILDLIRTTKFESPSLQLSSRSVLLVSKNDDQKQQQEEAPPPQQQQQETPPPQQQQKPPPPQQQKPKPPSPLEHETPKASDPRKEPPFIPSKYDYKKEAKRTESTLPDPVLNLEEHVGTTTTSQLPSSASRIVVLVMSARQNFEARQAIRDSWGKGHSNIIFVIGGPVPLEDVPPDTVPHVSKIATNLTLEQEQYHDLLDTIHPETYRGLPFKLHYAMKWIYNMRQKHNKSIDWIVKVDDNVVVRMNRLQKLILQKFNSHHPMIIGDIVPNSPKALRGKWAEDPHYTEKFYPPWPRGASGYVISQPIADYIGRAEDLYYYQGEDASLGIWIYEKFRDNSNDMTWISSMHDFHWQGCEALHVITGHDMPPDKIKSCFNKHGGDTIEEHKYRIHHQDQPTQLRSGLGPSEPDLAEQYDFF